jgi:GntR family transcriptional regulator
MDDRTISFYLEPDSGLATYLQIGRQVEHAIRLGRLQAGDQLPSVRDVVATLAINPNTVVKAYRDLEARGLVETRQGRGTFVAEAPRAMATPDDTVLQRRLQRWLADAIASGLTRQHLEALFETTMRDVFAEGAA